MTYPAGDFLMILNGALTRALKFQSVSIDRTTKRLSRWFGKTLLREDEDSPLMESIGYRSV